ncbi:MAG: hypothetical protein LBU69_04160 [Deltaproteobacteria bacterium]|nr:hypothetical protein [Deltaproteobacteria bacterium]
MWANKLTPAPPPKRGGAGVFFAQPKGGLFQPTLVLRGSRKIRSIKEKPHDKRIALAMAVETALVFFPLG